MSARVSPRRPSAVANPSRRGRAHLGAIARITVLAVVVSELITVALLKLLLGSVLVEGIFIALICSAPLSAWIADRQIRMREVIADQRDRLTDLNTVLEVRNRDLDAFARTVAHDLRNPLAAIVGTATVLLDDLPADGAERSDLLRSIVLSGEQATGIIEGLLHLHGIQHETRELGSVDSQATLDAAIETMAPAIADSGASIRRSSPFPLVRAHAPWLIEVWINLIGNAIKYGGSPPIVDLDSRTSGDGIVRFEVTDNGSGIRPEDRKLIFDEYQRGGRTDADGHGLGLAIVSRIVARLGGEVGVESPDGGGSMFWFTVAAANPTQV